MSGRRGKEFPIFGSMPAIKLPAGTPVKATIMNIGVTDA
jgi:hypothetical protein